MVPFSRRLSARILAMGVAVLAVTAATPEAQSPSPTQHVAGDVSNISIRNFGQVNANYYRGEHPREGDYAALAALGVRTVIALQPEADDEREGQRVQAAGMTFHRIPMSSHVVPTAAQIAEFMNIVTDVTRQPVYVHCAGGKHRTGVMTAIYRMEVDGWSADEAYREMKRYKFGKKLSHPEFRDFVYRYQPVGRWSGGAGLP